AVEQNGTVRELLASLAIVIPAAQRDAADAIGLPETRGTHAAHAEDGNLAVVKPILAQPLHDPFDEGGLFLFIVILVPLRPHAAVRVFGAELHVHACPDELRDALRTAEIAPRTEGHEALQPEPRLAVEILHGV